MSKRKIAVAMSGGVDSAVAALLLNQQGFDVEGFFLDLTADEDARQSVEGVALKLGIPLHVIDAGDKFESLVVDWMIAEYSLGNTPNPCIHCNKIIKWDYLFNAAATLGFQEIATGHYARICYNENGKPELLAGLDNEKDQSYFLSYLTQEDLRHTQLPLGEFSKTNVRNIASGYHLPNTNKRESQDLCFLKENINDFLKRRVDAFNKPGEIIDTDGKHLGEHEGFVYYTVGQRKGLRIAHKNPLYVVEKDIFSNTLIVGSRSEPGFSGLIAKETNWIEEVRMDDPLRAQVKIRYRSQPVWANIELLDNSRIRIHFDHPVKGVTPGQIAVIYNKEQVLGAGKICKPI